MQFDEFGFPISESSSDGDASGYDASNDKYVNDNIEMLRQQKLQDSKYLLDSLYAEMEEAMIQYGMILYSHGCNYTQMANGISDYTYDIEWSKHIVNRIYTEKLQYNALIEDNKDYYANYFNIIEYNGLNNIASFSKALMQGGMNEYTARNIAEDVFYVRKALNKAINISSRAKYDDKLAIAMIKYFIYAHTDPHTIIGSSNNEVVKLQDFPEAIKHACIYTKERITFLQLNKFQLPGTDIIADYYFCRACSKLYVPFHIVQSSSYDF